MRCSPLGCSPLALLIFITTCLGGAEHALAQSVEDIERARALRAEAAVPEDGVALPALSTPWGGLIGEDLGLNDDSSGFWRLSEIDASAEFVAETGYDGVCDLAWHPDGVLYAVTCSGDLFQMEASSGRIAAFGQLPVTGVNALTVGPDGLLYGASLEGHFFTVDVRARTYTFIASMGYSSSGDLVFADDGRLFATVRATSASDLLVEIDPATGAVRPVGHIGFVNVWGLAFDPAGTLYGGANPPSLFGYRPQLIRIDTTTGRGTAIGRLPSADSVGGLTWQYTAIPKPQWPVVFVHGTCSNGATWDTTRSALEARGWRFGGRITDAVRGTGLVNGDADFFAIDFSDPLIMGGLDAWATELQLHLLRIRQARPGRATEFTVVAHSAGGLAARAYLQSPGYAHDVRHLITYGTPHQGIPSADIARRWVEELACPDSLRFAKSQGINEMAADSAWLQALNGGAMPAGVDLTSLVGIKVSCSIALQPLLGVNDCVVPARSQDVSLVPRAADLGAAVKRTSRSHGDQPDDVINILWAIYRVGTSGVNTLDITLASPVDMLVTDPWGRIITRQQPATDLAQYEEVPDDDGTMHDIVTVPVAVSGRYAVSLLPGAGVPASSLYSLVVRQGQRETRLASQAPLSSAPTQPYGYEVAQVRYLAEGATGGFFSTRFALLNPGLFETAATLRYQPNGGAVVTQQLRVPPRTRLTIDPGAMLGSSEFATSIESHDPLVVDRTMTWGASGYGSHAETGIIAPGRRWYLAEGATHSNFDLFYLLQNPNPETAHVEVRFLRPAPAPPLVRTYPVPPRSRFNIWVDTIPELANTDVSAVFTADVPIIVERAMYASRPGEMFGAGHESAGVTEASARWFMAEGATGPYFDLFVLVANPTDRAAELKATYLLPGGSTVTKTYAVPPSSRFNIWVDYEDARLADTAVSTTIESTNGVPVIVERAMWWPGTPSTWLEAHNSAGSTRTATSWALAEGEVGGSRSHATYILLANTSSVPGTVRVTLVFEGGGTAERVVAVPPFSRTNVDVGADFPEARGRRFGALIDSLGSPAAEIVVERAMYSDAGGVRWAAGTNALATPVR
jgi:hypothetical protein